jgi:hypothetical protein
MSGADEFYIEPSSLTASGEDLLLAGTPSYVYHLERTDSPSDQNQVFGVVLRRDGVTLPVPLPKLDGVIGGQRTARRREGGWHVVFTQSDSLEEGAFAADARRLWYGVLRDTTWLRVEPLPIPDSLSVRPSFVSSLVAFGDSLAVAVIAHSSTASHVVVFTRTEGDWKANSLSLQSASYVEPVWDAAGTLRMAVVHPDARLESDANSLMLYSVGPEWTLLRRMAGGEAAPVHTPKFQAAGSGYLVGGVGEERVVLGPVVVTAWPLDQGRPTLSIDERVRWWDVISVAGNSLIGVVAPTVADGLPRDLRFYALSPDGVTLLATTQSPYAGGFAAEFLPPDEIVVAGPVVRDVSGGQLVATQLLRAEIHCGRG